MSDRGRFDLADLGDAMGETKQGGPAMAYRDSVYLMGIYPG
jgi:hypothetical protein